MSGLLHTTAVTRFRSRWSQLRVTANVIAHLTNIILIKNKKMKTQITFLVLILSIHVNSQVSDKPPIVPYSAFGHWVWEDHLHTTASVNYLVNGFLDREIPVNVVIFDSPWSTAYNNFEWDSLRYTNYRDLIKNLHEKKIKVLLWYTAMVNSSSREVIHNTCPTFDYVVENKFCTSEGKIIKWMKGQGVHIDFTNPKAVDWWHIQVNKALDLGIDGWKVDASAIFLGDSILTSKGLLTQEEFKYLFYKDIFAYTTSKNPESIIYTYGQIYVKRWDKIIDFPPAQYSHAQWSGDFKGNFQGLSEQLLRIYNSAEKGYIAPACEIGGYNGKPSSKKELIRYTQLASVVPMMVNGGNYGAQNHHLPWNHDDETVDIYCKYANLHLKIAPYLFSESVERHNNGGSIIKNISKEKGSHRLGDNIFIQTITTDSDTVQIDFPGDGRWIDYWDKTKIYNSSENKVGYYPIDKYPIFIRSGSIIPIITSNDNNFVEFEIYPDNVSQYHYHKPNGQGTRYTDIKIEVNEKKGTISISSDTKQNFKFSVVCFKKPNSVKGVDRFNFDRENSMLIMKKSGSSFEIKINDLIGYKNINAL